MYIVTILVLAYFYYTMDQNIFNKMKEENIYYGSISF